MLGQWEDLKVLKTRLSTRFAAQKDYSLFLEINLRVF
jgi:hypothetical protein